MPAKTDAAPSLPLGEVLSFLKETRGVPTWTIQELTKSLKISAAVANRILPFLQVQGYVEPVARGEWLTTVSGETISGSKPPRFAPETVASALSELAERIKAANEDLHAPFQIANAVAFGDFLSDRARVQAADVGIQLHRREGENSQAESALEQAAQREFLRKLKEKASVLNIQPYEGWMSSRRNRKLL